MALMTVILFMLCYGLHHIGTKPEWFSDHENSNRETDTLFLYEGHTAHANVMHIDRRLHYPEILPRSHLPVACILIYRKMAAEQELTKRKAGE